MKTARGGGDSWIGETYCMLDVDWLKRYLELRIQPIAIRVIPAE
jgi:hypothetical protein